VLVYSCLPGHTTVDIWDVSFLTLFLHSVGAVGALAPVGALGQSRTRSRVLETADDQLILVIDVYFTHVVVPDRFPELSVKWEC
jgi:hypothetical protein